MCAKCARSGKTTIFMADGCHYVCPLCDAKLSLSDKLIDIIKRILPILEMEDAALAADDKPPMYKEECDTIRAILGTIKLIEDNKKIWEIIE